ncbi:MAG: adenylate/guanylate cyclase domain-containing protein, partial [Pseudomonadota bacterium]
MKLQAKNIIGQVRLATGLILFAYLLSHFLNHALGLISLDAMELGRRPFLGLWRNPIGTIALYGALLIHMGLALWSLYRRRSLRMPAWEAAQLLLGLMIPPLLAIHIIGTRIAAEFFGAEDNYAYTLLAIWVFDPIGGLQQAIVLVVAWLHGCIGLHFWLRLKPWYAGTLPFGYATALLVPILGLLGFAAGGREVARLAEDPDWMAATSAIVRFPDAATLEFLYDLEHGFWAAFAALLAGTLAARGLRQWLIGQRAIAISYPDDRRVEVQPGTTILEA